MKQMKIFVFFGLASLFLFLACQKHLDVIATPPVTPITPAPPVIPPTETDVTVSASIQGRVTDQAGAPVKDAAVTSGSNSVQTDINGIFRFSGIQTSKYFGYIKVSKTGFFTGSRTIVTSTTGVNYIEVQLLPRTSSGNFDAASGGSVMANTGNAVTIPANGVVTASSNTSYAGTVNVFSSWIDPTDPKRNSRMPGDLRGTDTSNRTVALQTFGMVAIELEGSAGEKLQLAAGKTATISFPIPAASQAAAPPTIPLWYFNDTTGKWIEQGIATKNGTSYIGTVAHFTYWNCDIPSNLVYFNVNLKDQSGNPLAYTRLDITNTTTNDSRTGYSDSVGNVNGWVLKNTTLSFSVVDNCGTNLVTKSEGPFTSDQDLGTITVTINPTQMVTVHGTVVDCNNSPVTSGFASITLDGLNYGASVTNGNFSAAILRCASGPDSVLITVGNYTTQLQSLPQQFPVSGSDLNTGNLATCGGSFSQFINFTFNGTSYNITVPPDSIYLSPNAGYTFITGFEGIWTTPGYSEISLVIPDNLTGNTATTLNVSIGTSWYSNTLQQSVSCNVTEFDPSGGYIQGTFSGNISKDTTGALLPITGSFKVKRP
jgi:hypothetical protein